jgi:hypothetical protein
MFLDYQSNQIALFSVNKPTSSIVWNLESHSKQYNGRDGQIENLYKQGFMCNKFHGGYGNKTFIGVFRGDWAVTY